MSRLVCLLAGTVVGVVGTIAAAVIYDKHEEASLAASDSVPIPLFEEDGNGFYSASVEAEAKEV